MLGYKPSNLCHGIFKNMKILTKGKYSYSHEIYRQLMMSPPKNRIDIVPQAQIMVYELIHASQLYPKIQMLPVRRSSDYPHRPATSGIKHTQHTFYEPIRESRWNLRNKSTHFHIKEAWLHISFALWTNVNQAIKSFGIIEWSSTYKSKVFILAGDQRLPPCCYNLTRHSSRKHSLLVLLPQAAGVECVQQQTVLSTSPESSRRP